MGEPRRFIEDVKIEPDELPPPPLNWQEIESKIDNYEIESKEGKVEDPSVSARRVTEILGSDPVDEILHKDTHPEGTTRDRKLFIQALKNALESKNNEGLTDPIRLKELLGKEGLRLYKKAIKEESKSKAFRNAVFLKSTQYHSGPKWRERLVLWIGGPSGSGKSHAVRAMLDKVSKDVMSSNPEDKSGNLFVSIDGEIGRDTSQMARIVLHVALLKQYKGISDLHKKTKINMKGKIIKAALKNQTLSLVIPNTFVRMRNESLRLKYILTGKFSKYSEMKNVKQVFAEVTGGKDEAAQDRFRRTVAFQGKFRAWFIRTAENLQKMKLFRINNQEMGCASKIYEAQHFEEGVTATVEARNAYIKAQQAQGKNVYHLTYTNDRVFIYYDSNPQGNKWFECPDNFDEIRGKFTPPPEAIALSHRAAEKWRGAVAKAYMPEEENREEALKKWLKDPNGGDKPEFTSALMDLTIRKPDIKPISDETLSKPNHFNIISVADIEKYIKEHHADSNISYPADISGKALYSLIEQIDRLEKEKKSDSSILKRFENAYVKVGEKSGGANKPGEFGGIYKNISDGSTYLFKQDTSYKRLKILERKNPLHYVAKDISEFVATRMSSKIYTNVSPEMVARKHPAQDAPYIGSKFFDGYKNLFKDIYENHYGLPQLEALHAELKDAKDIKDVNLTQYIENKNVDPAYTALIKKLQVEAIDIPAAVDIVKAHIDKVNVEVSEIRKRPKFLGTQQFLRTKVGKIFKNAIQRKTGDNKLVYSGIEKALVLSALFADNDVHSENIGVVITKDKDGKESRECVRIDFGAALAKEYFNTKRGLKLGSSQRFQFFSANPTNHFTEYPKSIKYTETFANTIRVAVENLKLGMDEQRKLFNDKEFNLWSHEDRVNFAKHIGMKNPEDLAKDSLNTGIAAHIKAVLEHRMRLLKEYELDIRLSQCFTKVDGKIIFDENKRNEFKDIIKNNKDEFNDYFTKGKFKFRSDLFTSGTPQALLAKHSFGKEVGRAYQEVLQEEQSTVIGKLFLELKDGKVDNLRDRLRTLINYIFILLSKEVKQAGSDDFIPTLTYLIPKLQPGEKEKIIENLEKQNLMAESIHDGQYSSDLVNLMVAIQAKNPANPEKQEKTQQDEVKHIKAAKSFSDTEYNALYLTNIISPTVKEVEEKKPTEEKSVTENIDVEQGKAKTEAKETKTAKIKSPTEEDAIEKAKVLSSREFQNRQMRQHMALDETPYVQSEKMKFDSSSALTMRELVTSPKIKTSEASFYKHREQDGSLSIVSWQKPILQKDGKITRECVQYVKDQIREIFKEFPPPGTIIEVYDKDLLQVYMLICERYKEKLNITCEDRTGVSVPNLVVPNNLKHKLKLGEHEEGHMPFFSQKSKPKENPKDVSGDDSEGESRKKDMH